MTIIAKNDGNGKVSSPRREHIAEIKADNTPTPDSTSTPDIRFDDIQFIYMDKPSSRKYKSKDVFRDIFINRCGKIANWKIARGYDELVRVINTGYTHQLSYKDDNSSRYELDVNQSDMFAIDIDCFADDKDIKKGIIKDLNPGELRPDAPIIYDILDNEFVKSHFNFYQESWTQRDKNHRNIHLYGVFDETCTDLAKRQVFIKAISDRLRKELNTSCIDKCMEDNKVQVVFPGQSDVKFLNKSSLINIDEFLAESGVKYEPKDDRQDVKSKATLPGKGITDKVLRHIRSHTPDWNETDYFNLHPHNFKQGKGRWRGSNPFSPTDSSGTSFTVWEFKDDGLPPIWFDGSRTEGNNNHSIIDYYYRYWKKDDSYAKISINNGNHFKRICNDVCDHLGIPKADFSDSKKSDDDDLPVIAKYMKVLDNKFGDDIRWNELDMCVEICGEKLDFDCVESWLWHRHQLCFKNQKKAIDAIIHQARLNRYHPVAEYLLDCAQNHPNTPDLDKLINNLATELLGTEDDIYNVMLKKHLLASVKRIFHPGTFHKSVVVLSGEQNIGKSSFIRYICPSENLFTDSLDASDKGKDTKIKINKYWHLEIGEIDQYFRKSDRSHIKSFISSPSDDYRAPYSRNEESHPRQSVFWATTNEENILQDATGSVRFWCIPCKDIDLDKVKQLRDKVWAGIMHLYMQDESHFLTDEEIKASEKNNLENYTKEDDWEEKVINLISHYDYFSIPMIYEILEIPEKDRSNKYRDRIMAILRKNGWDAEKNARKFKYGRQRVWKNPGDSDRDFNQILHHFSAGTLNNLVKSILYPALSREDRERYEAIPGF